MSQLSGLTQGAETRFELRRDAGISPLPGELRRQARPWHLHLHRRSRLRPREMGGKLSTHRLMELAVYDVLCLRPRVESPGLRPLRGARQAVPRPRSGAGAPPGDRRSGGPRPGAGAQLMEFRLHGVTPELARAVVAAGVSRPVILGSGGAEHSRHRALVRPGLERERIPVPLPLPARPDPLARHHPRVAPRHRPGRLWGRHPRATRLLHAHGIDGDAIRGALSQGRRRPTPEELMSLRSRGVVGQVIAGAS